MLLCTLVVLLLCNLVVLLLIYELRSYCFTMLNCAFVIVLSICSFNEPCLQKVNIWSSWMVMLCWKCFFRGVFSDAARNWYVRLWLDTGTATICFSCKISCVSSCAILPLHGWMLAPVDMFTQSWYGLLDWWSSRSFFRNLVAFGDASHNTEEQDYKKVT